MTSILFILLFCVLIFFILYFVYCYLYSVFLFCILKKCDMFIILDCTNGFFGYNCSEECHCSDTLHCNRTSGECKTPGCLPGWKGLACNEGMFNIYIDMKLVNVLHDMSYYTH